MTQITAPLPTAPAFSSMPDTVTLPRQVVQEMARDLRRTAAGLATENMSYSAGKLATHAERLEAVAGTCPLPMTEEQMEADVWDRR